MRLMEQLLVLVGSSKFREQGRTNQNSSKYEYCTRQKDVNIFFNETHPSISKGDGWEGGGGGVAGIKLTYLKEFYFERV